MAPAPPTAPLRQRSGKAARSPAAPVALAYVVLASLWILFSDWAASLLVSEERYLELQTLKGWLFVGVTGVLLWSVLQGFWRARMAAQEGESQSRVRLESALSALNAAFVHLQAREPHAILTATEGFTALSGYSRAELAEAPAMPARQIIHPEDQRLVLTAVRVSAQDGRPFVFEFRLLTRTGDVCWVWCKGRPLPEGQAVEMFLTDVSQLKQLKAQLVEAQGVEALAELAAGVAHDVNNVLTTITGYSSLVERFLEDSGAGAGQALEHASEIQAAALQAHELNQRLMALGRPSGGESRDLDLNQLVQGAAALVRPLLRGRITLECRRSPEPVLVRADPGQLKRVVVNLAVNARDAMPEGGRLELAATVCHATDTPELARADLPPGDYACLSVSDTGTGIPEEDREKIFTPFFTTKPTGTGLGLAVVAGLVEQNQGRILVESTAGEGTRFDIVLPRLTTGGTVSDPQKNRPMNPPARSPVWSWRPRSPPTHPGR